MRNKTIFLTIAMLFILGLALTACGSKSTQSPTQGPASSATAAPASTATVAPTAGIVDGKTLVETRCTRCHTLDRIVSKKYTTEQWTKLVARMISNGAKLTSDEQKIVIAYLAKTYAP